VWQYKLAQLFFSIPVGLLWRLKVGGIEKIPAEGGFILASNHASYLDPVILGTASPYRRVTFMAKEELFRPPIFGPLIRSMGALPIKRGGVDRNRFQSFGQVLRDQRVGLVVFPEGTRTHDGTLGRARRGVGALCLAAGVPVVPAFIRGSYEVMPRHRMFPRLRGNIEVRFGNPVEWSPGELEAAGDPSGALAALIMKKIEELSMTEGRTLSFRNIFKAILAKPNKGNPTPGDGAGTTGEDGSAEARRV
jgi:1-acyl-sn-glycerol-3-phosphate acyltransferase